MIIGQKTYLKAIEHDDLPTLLEWRNNPHFRKYFREYRELSLTQQQRWFESKVLNDPTTVMFSIRDIHTNQLLGCCGFVYVNWVHRHADLSLYIGWKNSYIDDNGFAADACNSLLRYGYGELGLNKVWTEIYEFDHRKEFLYKKIGFNLDGKLRQNYFFEGRYWDSLILSLLSNEFSLVEIDGL